MNYLDSKGKRRVVITGGGMLTALGEKWADVLAKLKSGKNCIKYIKDWERFDKMNTRLACPYEGELPVFPRKKIRGMGRVALLSLAATEQA